MQYLEAMGIDAFVPRLILPGAREPELCPLPTQAANQPPVVLGDNDVSAVLARTSLAELVNESRDLADVTSSVSESDVSDVEASAPSSRAFFLDSEEDKPNRGGEPRLLGSSANANEREPKGIPAVEPLARFSLAVWRASESILVIDSHEPGAALPTESLLINLMRACGVQVGRLSVSDLLSWPMVELPGKPQGWPAAREMVGSFLDGKLLSQPVATILLFGADSFFALTAGEADEAEYLAHRLKKIPVDAFLAEAVVLPSLADILRKPSLKADVWACLLANGFVGPVQYE